MTTRHLPTALAAAICACAGILAPATRACTHGHALGRATPVDQATATLYFRQACRAGSASGCINLSMRIPNRIGPREDAELLLDVYEDACARDNLFACRRAALIHELGWSERSTIERADALHLRTCEALDRTSCNDLAWSRCHNRRICTQHEEDLAKRALPVDVDGAFWDTYAFVLCQRAKTDAARDAYTEACERSKEFCAARCEEPTALRQK